MISRIDASADEESLEEGLARFWASAPEAIQDPFPLLARLREESPVHVHGDLVFVTRYDDVQAVLMDPQRFSSEFMNPSVGRVQRLAAGLPAHQQADFRDMVELERMLTFHADGEEHQRRRQALYRLFTPRRIAEYQQIMQTYVDEVLDELETHDEVDLGPMTRLLPSWLIAYLLGVPREDARLLIDWVLPIGMNLHSTGALEGAHRGASNLQQYLDDALAGRRATHRETELFAAIRASAEGWPDKRLLGIFVEMNLGGIESARGLLGGGIAALMSHRSQWDRLVADPTQLPVAVEELLRFVSPGLWTSRVPAADTKIRGVPIQRHQTVIVMVGAANRDPAVFANPNTLDVGRPARQSLTFGHGAHYCLGQALVKLEANVLFGALLRRYPKLELAGEPLVRTGHAQNPALERIPVRLNAGR